MFGQTIKMTEKEFKQWLLKDADANKDGHISREELRCALRALDVSFAGLKSWRGIVHADRSRNKHIEGSREIDELIKYAGKHWGIVVTKS